MQSQRPLSRREASDYLLEKHGIRRAPTTLAKLATVGGGPVFRKANRAVIYDPPALDAFAVEITSQPLRTTSEKLSKADAGPRQRSCGVIPHDLAKKQSYGLCQRKAEARAVCTDGASRSSNRKRKNQSSIRSASAPGDDLAD
jgi:hypothetical protein